MAQQDKIMMIGGTVVLALIYYLGAIFGQIMAIPPGNITLVWLPSGLALAALLRWGTAALPGVFLGAVAANFIADASSMFAPPLAALTIGLGSTLQAWCAAWLLGRLQLTTTPYATVASTWRFVLVALVAATISSSVGVLSQVLTNTLGNGLWRAWLTWWGGDVLGMLVFAPPLLALFRMSFTTDHRRLLALVMLMAGLGVVVATMSISVSYRTFIDSQQERMRDLAQAQVRLLEAVARYDQSSAPQGNGREATLLQVGEAYSQALAQRNNVHFLLARREGAMIVYLQADGVEVDLPPVSQPFNRDIEPAMTRALSGESGSIITRDYRGFDVLAVYEPVPALAMGLVVSIDMKVLRRPFLSDTIVVLLITLVLVVVCIRWFHSISAPLQESLRRKSDELQRLVDEQTLELRESSKQLKALLEAMPEGMVITDARGEVVLVNAKLCQITGYTRDELLGCAFATLVPDVAMAQYLDLRDATGTAGQPKAAKDLVCRRKDGSVFPVALSFNAFETTKGILVVASVRDITRQRAYEEELISKEARVNLALGTGDMEVYEIDLDAGSIDSNLLLYRKYGYEVAMPGSSRLDADPWRRIIHPADKALVMQHVTDFSAGDTTTYHIEYRVLTATGTTRWIQSTGVVTARKADGSPRKLLGLRRDITEIKTSQLTLQATIAELETFNHLATGRELRMLELKTQINGLLLELGRAPRYEIPE